MDVILYHEIAPESKDRVLVNGIKQGEHSEKTDSEKKKADAFLDTHLPEWAKEAGLTRNAAIYAYLAEGDNIVDITSGELVAIQQIATRSNDVLLGITVNQAKCYVSDLDLYDTLVRSLALDEQDSTREHLADRYWERMVPLEGFEKGTIERPEILVFVDIDPKNIQVVESR